MLERLPGFSIVEADADLRGYAAAQGNVLIDGARPSSKREDIGQLLKRIPSASVERIELIRSGAVGIDMGGFAVLANARGEYRGSPRSRGLKFDRWMDGTDCPAGIRAAEGRTRVGRFI